MKSSLLLTLLLLIFNGFSTAYAATQASEAELPVISIQASRFVYSPNKIKLKQGQSVVLEIEATDHLHGFSIPELKVRVDAPQGQKIRVVLTPTKAGVFVFYCDIFCGSGHEEMSGEISVES
jgi:cytochrome c oxidase subunit 2